MQDRFVGDIGDFGKYGLLRALCAPSPPDRGDPLLLGVVWYRTPDAGVEYLNNHDDYRQCDPVLYGALASMVYSGRRNVLSVQNAGILPSDTVFHDTYLGGASDRIAYMQDALRTTKQCAIVFADPDTGIDGAKPAPTRRKLAHCYLEELEQYVQRGQSLVVYQHNTHRRGWVDQGITQLAELGSSETPFALQYQGRVFLVLPAPEHNDLLRARAKTMLQGPWGQHFTSVGL